MSQILYWNDVAAGVRHATLVHTSGHILLRNVPEDKVEDVKESFRAFRNTLTDIPNVKPEDLQPWLDDMGFTEAPDFNPPLVAFEWPVQGAEGDSIRDMKLADLQALATSLGLDPTGKKKAELVEMIQAKQNEGGGN